MIGRGEAEIEHESKKLTQGARRSQNDWRIVFAVVGFEGRQRLTESGRGLPQSKTLARLPRRNCGQALRVGEDNR